MRRSFDRSPRTFASCAAMLMALAMLPFGAASAHAATRKSPTQLSAARSAATSLSARAARIRKTTERAWYYDEGFTDVAALVDYILPTSATERLVWDDIAQLTPRMLSRARNEILARHGYRFEHEELIHAFGSKPWYRPAGDFSNAMLSRIERDNIAFLMDAEAIQAGSMTRYEGPFRVDLDGDGENDSVSWTQPPDPEGRFDEVELCVNDARIAVFGENMQPQLYALDIDPSDRYREIVAFDAGPSDDPTIHVYRYDGKRIRSIGQMPSYVEDVLFDGKGGMRAYERGDILHTWRRMVGYELRGGKLVRIEEAYTLMNTPAVIVQPLTLYRSPTSRTVVHTAEEGDVVLLRRTDDRKAIEVVCASGEVGWMRYASRKENLAYFEGLFQAD